MSTMRGEAVAYRPGMSELLDSTVHDVSQRQIARHIGTLLSGVHDRYQVAQRPQREAEWSAWQEEVIEPCRALWTRVGSGIVHSDLFFPVQVHNGVHTATTGLLVRMFGAETLAEAADMHYRSQGYASEMVLFGPFADSIRKLAAYAGVSITQRKPAFYRPARESLQVRELQEATAEKLQQAQQTDTPMGLRISFGRTRAHAREARPEASLYAPAYLNKYESPYRTGFVGQTLRGQLSRSEMQRAEQGTLSLGAVKRRLDAQVREGLHENERQLQLAAYARELITRTDEYRAAISS